MATNIRLNIFLNAIKTKQLKSWFYIFRNGHPFLLKEEVDIYELPDCDIVRKKCENDCIGGGAFLNTTK